MHTFFPCTGFSLDYSHRLVLLTIDVDNNMESWQLKGVSQALLSRAYRAEREQYVIWKDLNLISYDELFTVQQFDNN